MSIKSLELVVCLLDTHCVSHKQEQGFQAIMFLLVLIVLIVRNQKSASQRSVPALQQSLLVLGGLLANLFLFFLILEVLLRLDTKGVLGNIAILPLILLGVLSLFVSVLLILFATSKNSSYRYSAEKRYLVPLVLLSATTIIAVTTKGSFHDGQSPSTLIGVSFLLTLLVDAILRAASRQPVRRSKIRRR